ncbi:SpoIIE family protein phosphatase [Leptospira sp. GIMC2001]|uniref:SpoIIE family protein phosphatase n=1 Tax=Leptospira sp. GIMC2001 TaxID=1513297 RepID=UPI00234B2C21|nr:SpoIIE family protein phosphatase [Leptospira sp. GIMC2001]WCL48624.1 SpoIIE family protein phosphatase [Leptospira sp. GIMC2001]
MKFYALILIFPLFFTNILGQSDESKIEWNPEKNPVISLDGNWDFYWNEWLEPSKTPSNISWKMDIPGTWNSTLEDHGIDSALGYGTFRILVNSDTLIEDGAIRLPDVASAGIFIWNGRELHRNGNPSISPDEHRAKFQVSTHPIVIQKGINELLIQVSNYSYHKGGIWEPIKIGKRIELSRKQFMVSSRELFLSGSIFIMAFYHFGIFFLRSRDKSSLWFALFCLLISLRILVTGERVLFQLIPEFSWYGGLVIEYSGFYLAPAFFLFFIYELFPDFVPKKIFQIVGGIFVIFESFIFLLPTTVFPSLNIYFYVYLGLSILLGIYVTVRAVLNRKDGSIIFAFGFIVLVLCTINDSLNAEDVIYTFHSLSIGLFLFIFSQSFLLSKKFSQAFDEVEKMSIKLMTLDKLKDEFLANTTHELKTPLNGIIGLAESVSLGSAGAIPPGARDDLEMIVYSGKRLSHLVDDILDFSKMKNSGIELNTSPTDLQSMMEIVLATSKSILGQKDITLSNQIPKDFPLIEADENRLQQILTNLIGNAIKFTEHGSVLMQAELDSSKFAKISIKDTGIGIPKDKQKDIFISFEQVDSSISRRYGGTGLGLTISKQLVELHGGTIGVESEPTKGSCFYFTIPISENQNREMSINSSKKNIWMSKSNDEVNLPTSIEPVAIGNSGAIVPSSKAAMILIVDDEPVNRKVLRNYMNLENYQIREAQNGLEAIHSIQADGPPDLILLDVMMPGMSGYEVAHFLREKYSLHELPILILTAKNQISDVIAGLEAGANDYLSKPFDKRELITRVRNLLLLKQAVLEQTKLFSIQNELSVAKKLQSSILPAYFPQINGLSLSSFYLPMDAVGGDFYDYHHPSETEIGILLADVSGHGVPAALVSAMLKIAFGTELDNCMNPIKLIQGIDNKLKGKTKGAFLTASYLYFDMKVKQLYHVRAGHHALYIYKKSTNQVIDSLPKGKVLGVFETNEFSLDSIQLDKGDKIVLCTDGILEASNNEGVLFGEDRLKLCLLDNHDLDPESWSNLLMEEVGKWSNHKSAEDDIALIVIDVH